MDMGVTKRTGAVGIVCLGILGLLCSSCITLSMPKTGNVDPSATASTTSAGSQSAVGGKPSDWKLVSTWELLYQENDKGEKEPPRDATRTLIEFTDSGRVIFNRMDKDNSDRLKSRSGKYGIDKDEIVITDDRGNTVKWPYQVTGETLVLVMPEVNKKFHWRRYQ